MKIRLSENWISINGSGKTKLHTNGNEEVIKAYRTLKNRMERELGGDKLRELNFQKPMDVI